jgi:hypothetical protein
MAQSHPSLRKELSQSNQRIADRCNKIGMSLKVYKTIKAFTQLVGAAAGIYAMSLGADPLSTFALVAIIVSGPEALDYLLSKEVE